MSLKYVYVIQWVTDEKRGEVEWAGTQKWRGQRHLENILMEGISLGHLCVYRMKDGQRSTLSRVDIYELMQIDQGEQF